LSPVAYLHEDQDLAQAGDYVYLAGAGAEIALDHLVAQPF